MQVRRFASAGDFLQRAEAFLVEHEVENGLPLAIANQLRLYPKQVTRPPYLAAVEHQGEVLTAAVMTPPLRLRLSLAGSRAALGPLAADVAEFDRALSGVSGPVPTSEWFAEHWHAQTGAAYQHSMAMRNYQLTHVTYPASVRGSARRASASDRDLLIEWFAAFDLEAFGSLGDDTAERVDTFLEMSTRGVFLWENPGPVSLAGFGGLTPHGARIGPVYTPPSQRGHGYASTLTAWLSQYLLDSGRQFCTLFTNLSNPTANHIYQTLGYVPVCDVAEYKFATATV
jgi:predicted GNAT family acetyltransferase